MPCAEVNKARFALTFLCWLFGFEHLRISLFTEYFPFADGQDHRAYLVLFGGLIMGLNANHSRIRSFCRMLFHPKPRVGAVMLCPGSKN
jgi:hypothetical protein